MSLNKQEKQHTGKAKGLIPFAPMMFTTMKIVGDKLGLNCKFAETFIDQVLTQLSN
jgi:hypothetical protein